MVTNIDENEDSRTYHDNHKRGEKSITISAKESPLFLQTFMFYAG